MTLHTTNWIEPTRRPCLAELRDVPRIARLADLCGIVVAAFAASASHGLLASAAVDIRATCAMALVVGILFVGAGELRGYYRLAQICRRRAQIRRVAFCWLGAWAFLALASLTIEGEIALSRAVVAATFVLAPFLLLALRLCVVALVERAAARGLFRGEPVAVLTLGAAHWFETTGPGGLDIVCSRRIGAFSGPDRAGGALGETVAAFAREVVRSRARRILVAVSADDLRRLPEVEAALRRLPLSVSIVLHPDLATSFARPVELDDETCAFELHAPPRGIMDRVLKRALDVTVAAAGLVFFAPLLLVIAAAVRLDSEGPVIFRQRRRGFNGRDFLIYKFRTMHVLETDGPVTQASRGDRRITRVGRRLRSMSLDELPQLLNILNGDMSLVGPRPHAVAHDTYYDRMIADYCMRRHMKPGLTGWAQVNGLRGETPTIARMEQRLRHDLDYIDRWSIWLDLWILLRTVPEVLRRRNAF